MASRRRIAWVIVGLMVLAGVGIGLWWHVRRSTGPRLLARAQLAIRAGRLDKGLSLADEYIRKYPDDWRGHYTKADVLGRQGRYEEARPVLAKARTLDGADETAIALRLADTFAFAAVRSLSADQGPRDANALTEAVSLLERANEILAAHKPADEARALDIDQNKGLNYHRISEVHSLWANRLARTAREAEAAGEPTAAGEAEKEAESHRHEQARFARKTIEVLGDVIDKDCTRSAPAELLVRLCIREKDKPRLTKLHHAWFADDPNAADTAVAPVAAMMCTMYRLNPEAGMNEPNTLRDVAGDLDRLLAIDKNKDNPQLELARARVHFRQAQESADPASHLAESGRLSKQVLEAQPKNATAQLFHAQVLMAQADADPGSPTAREKLAQAERELFVLRSAYANPAQAELAPETAAHVLYWYAEAARKTGKVELAREAMQALTKIPTHALEHNETALRRFRGLRSQTRQHVIRMLLAGGFADQALEEARALRSDDPNSPAGLDLLVRAARQANQPQAALEALRDVWKGQSSDLAMLLAVASGYTALEDPKKAGEAFDAILALAADNPPKTGEEVRAVALALARKGRRPEAEKLLAGALQEQPDSAWLCHALGIICRDEGRHFQAEEYLRKAARLVPSRPENHLDLARLLWQLGELDSAEDALAAPALATEIDAALLRIRIKHRRGQPVDAELRAVLARPDAGNRSRRVEAEIDLAERRFEKCKETCLKALEKNPDAIEFRPLLATARLAMGHRDACVEQWKTVLKAQPFALRAYQWIAAVRLGSDANDAPPEGTATQPARTSAKYTAADLKDLEAELQGVDGAKDYMVKLVLAGLYSRIGQHDRAMALCEETARSSNATAWAVLTARTRRADLLMREGKTDDALSELDRLTAAFEGRPGLSNVMAAKARLLVGIAERTAQQVQQLRRRAETLESRAAGPSVTENEARRFRAEGKRLESSANGIKAQALARQGQAEAILLRLRQRARDKQEPSTGRRVARMHARLANAQDLLGDTESRQAQLDQALTACGIVQELLPKDPRAYILRAQILSAAQQRDEEVAALYRQAVELNPYDRKLYEALAGACEAQNEPHMAYDALSGLERLGEYGRQRMLLLQGSLLARWGLQAHAVERYQALRALGAGRSPEVCLALARSLAGIGRKEEAREVIAEIPADSLRYYVPGQLLAVAVADSPQDGLGILRALGEKRPGAQGIVLRQMILLIQENRPEEALAAYETFRNSEPVAGKLPVEAAEAALQAAIRADDLPKARAIAAELADKAPTPQRSLRAALLEMDSDPNAARRRLPEPDKAGVYPAVLGLCLARKQHGKDAAKPWAARVNALQGQLRMDGRRVTIPATLRLLCALLADDKKGATAVVAGIGAGIDPEVVGELLSREIDAPETVRELVVLAKTHVARQLGLPELAQRWSLAALKARPTCLWAAMEMTLSAPDAAAVKAALPLIKPPDSALGQQLRAELLLHEGKPAEAAPLFGAMANRGPEIKPDFLLRQAMALEAAGDFAEALALYRKVMQTRESPVAANNAAYLVMQLHPRDSAKLEEAAKWVETARQTLQAPQLLDTAGWLAHLQGRDEDALPLLRRVVRALPDDPEVHCHLGVVEAAAGDKQWAAWHLGAAVDLGKRLKAEGAEISAAGEQSIRLAAEKLASLRAVKEAN